MVASPRLFDIPFASGGDTVAVPDGAQGNGSVSYTQGFGLLYSTAVSSGGFNFPRAQHNQLLNDITSFAQQMQLNGVPLFYPDVATAFGGYPKYARVLYTDGHVYQSLIDDNTDADPSISANWQISDASSVIPGSDCRLIKSGSNLVLTPYAGNLLNINSANFKVPAAGVSLAPTGLTPATLYYIYAFISAGVMTLEASATAYAISTTNGMPIKTGDTTRTCVGMAYIDTGPAFADTLSKRYVRSYFNRQGMAIESTTPYSSQTTTSATYGTILVASEITLVVFADDIVHVANNAVTSVNSAGQSAGSSIGIDNITPQGVPGQMYSAVSGQTASAIGFFDGNLTDGAHIVMPLGNVNGGATATFHSGGLTGFIR